MQRRVSSTITAFLILFTAQDALSQEWASKMFDEHDHDFGMVARGSDTVHRFQITNRYKENIRLKSVRSSCGCTSPSIEGDLLKTYETGYVVAKFNTRTFTGIHSATLTVSVEYIDKGGIPRPGQVQLRVHGNIRGDIVFEPGSVIFGAVDQGDQLEKTVAVRYAGRSGWRIEDVRSASGDLEVELTERHRSRGRVLYDLLVRLRPTANPGFLNEQLALITNDSRNPRVPLDIEGRIIPELSVAPENLVFGDVEAAGKITKRFIVKGKKPFRITSVDCDESCFAFKTDDQSKDHHIVEATFNAKANLGRLKKAITIQTDRGETYQVTCTAYATVVEATPSKQADVATTTTTRDKVAVE